MVEPENREAGFSCSNGMTFFGSGEDSFSLKTMGCGNEPDRGVGLVVKPEIRTSDKS